MIEKITVSIDNKMDYSRKITKEKKNGQNGQIYSYKMNDFWKSHVQHGDCINNVVLYT